MHRAYLEFSGPAGATLPWSLLRVVDEGGGDTGFGGTWRRSSSSPRNGG